MPRRSRLSRKWQRAPPPRADEQQSCSPPISASVDARARQSGNRNLGSLGEWNEFGGVAGHHGKATGLPIRLGCLDAVLARRHEIPPDMARSIHGGAADQDKMRIAERRYLHAIAGLEHQQALRRMVLAADLNLTRNHVKRALLEFNAERQDCTGFKPHLGKDRLP